MIFQQCADTVDRRWPTHVTSHTTRQMSSVPSNTIANGTVYNHHPAHRNNTPRKSQWLIPEHEELRIFELCLARTWIVGTFGWGLHLVNGHPDYLGVAQDRVTQVFIAKFVREPAAPNWHGYPAEHSRTWDRPDDTVLEMWLLGDVLPPAKVRKISKGQPCKL